MLERRWKTALLSSGLFLLAATFSIGGEPTTDAPRTRAAGDFVAKDFRFASGETLQELRLHYTTLGTKRTDASGRTVNAVLLLHGTGGSGAQFLKPQFERVLFGPGKPLD